MLAIGGSGLNWHDVKSYFRPNAVGSYTFDDKNNIVFNTAKKKYEGAILMDCSQCPIHPTLAPNFREICEEGCSRDSGARSSASAVHVVGLCGSS